MKQLAIILVLLIFSSCIPLRIAPNIDDYKIKVAKKFKRKLPKTNAFIFEDPKEADAFYNYINIKYNLKLLLLISVFRQVLVPLFYLQI